MDTAGKQCPPATLMYTNVWEFRRGDTASWALASGLGTGIIVPWSYVENVESILAPNSLLWSGLWEDSYPVLDTCEVLTLVALFVLTWLTAVDNVLLFANGLFTLG